MGNGLITGITAITALIATVINLIAHLGSVKKSEEAKREDDYYNKVLRPYIKKVHESSTKNIAFDFFNDEKINEPFIPPYIRYVYYSNETEEKRNDQLNKFLIIDYIKMYENENRAVERFFKVANRVEKIFIILLSALGFVSTIMVGFSFLLYNLAYPEMWTNYKWIAIVVIELILSVMAIGCFFGLLYYAKVDKDMYSTRKNKIDKQLKNLDADFIRITGNNYY